MILKYKERDVFNIKKKRVGEQYSQVTNKRTNYLPIRKIYYCLSRTMGPSEAGMGVLSETGSDLCPITMIVLFVLECNCGKLSKLLWDHLPFTLYFYGEMT